MVPLIVLILLLFPFSSHATTYYVATTGSNANNGTDETTPFLTVAHCVTTMIAGDTCLVRGGTYAESEVRFRRSGTASAPITLKNYPGEAPVLDFINPNSPAFDRITIQHSSGQNVAIGWIIIEGLELTGGHDGIKYYSLHDAIFRNLHIHDNSFMGILGIGGVRILFEKNIINHNGRFAACDAGTTTMCFHDHGLYVHGQNYTIRNNVIYDHQGYGISQNGASASVYNSSVHPSQEFSGAHNWIVESNTFAYSRTRGGYNVWGPLCSNLRLENNIFYENNVQNLHNAAQGVEFVGGSPNTGMQIRNNHFYASGSGNTAQYSGTQPPTLVSTGNVVNVSPPAFVNGGNNALPASPDFRLTASAPVNIARVNEFTNNSTLVVGAYKTVGTPTASITTNKITMVLPMSTAVPVQGLSTTGVTVGCSGANCPGSPSVSSVSPAVGTDSQVEITISGISGNACVATNQNWTISYAPGTWTANDNVGPSPGYHQAIFAFTSLAVTNQCTGSAATGYPSGYHIYYKFDEGTGTNANDESANNLDCTLTNTPTWGTGKTGTSMVVAAGSTQHCAIPWGSGVNPTTQSMTIFSPVLIATGAESATHYVAGPDHGTNQRTYVCARNGTWRLAIQGTTCSATAASNLAVTAGWNVLTLIFDSTTDTFTLYKDNVAGTGGATGAYTSFTFATNWKLGQVASLNATGGTYDDFLVYLSIQSVSDLVDAFNGVIPPPTSGTLKQAAVRFHGVVLDSAGSPIAFGAAVRTIDVPKRGGAVVLFEIKCNAGTNCGETAFKLVASKNGSATFQQVPGSETIYGTWMWGLSTEAHLNNGPRATSLTGSCTMQTGATLMTADQVPSLALAQNTCTVLAYIVHVDGVAGVDYFDYKLITQSGLDLPGGYDEIARIRVVNPMGGGVGY